MPKISDLNINLPAGTYNISTSGGMFTKIRPGHLFVDGCTGTINACEPSPLTVEKLEEVVRHMGLGHLLNKPKETTKMLQQVIDFHDKFEVPTNEVPGFMDAETMKFRLGFLQEELDEINKAYKQGNLEDFLDGLVDLIWVALGTAHVCALPFAEAWQEVAEANMRKVKAQTALSSKRGFGGDIVKPEDWQGPNIKKILARRSAELRQLADKRKRDLASRAITGGNDRYGRTC